MIQLEDKGSLTFSDFFFSIFPITSWINFQFFKKWRFLWAWKWSQ